MAHFAATDIFPETSRNLLRIAVVDRTDGPLSMLNRP
jgi:hypothetical protein